jgi:type IV secretory pathway VirB10-like protein
MPEGRDHKIRLRVWLLCLIPIVAIGVLGVYLVAEKKPAARRTAPATAEETETPAPVSVAPPTPQAPPVPAQSARAAAPTPAAPSPSTSAEALREIDQLLVRPPDSGQWTPDQKNAYRAKLIDELTVRQHRLEHEIAAAHRSGDTATEQTRTATLDYLRRRREVLEAAVGSPPGEGAAADAGP